MLAELFKSFILKVAEYQEFIVWSFFFGIVHTLFSPKNRSVMAYFISFCASVPIGTLAGAWAHGNGYADGNAFLVTAVAALMAQDIIKTLLAFSGFIKENSPTIFQSIIDAVIARISGK